MGLDVGVLNHILSQYMEVFSAGVTRVQGSATGLLQKLLILEIVLMALFWAITGSDFVGRFLKKVLSIGFFIWVVTEYPRLLAIVASGFVHTGQIASGSSFAFLTDPSGIIEVGLRTVEPVASYAQENMGITNLLETIFFGMMLIIVMFAYGVLAITVLLTRVEFGIVTTLGLILIPFGVFKPTAFIAERVFGGILAFGIKLMVVGFIVGIGMPILNGITPPPEPTWSYLFLQAVSVFTIFLLAVRAPGIATSLISGGPTLSAGAAAGAAAGGAAIGSFVAAPAKSAISAYRGGDSGKGGSSGGSTQSVSLNRVNTADIGKVKTVEETSSKNGREIEEAPKGLKARVEKGASEGLKSFQKGAESFGNAVSNDGGEGAGILASTRDTESEL